MTEACLHSLTSKLLSGCTAYDFTAYDFTAPRPSPYAVEGHSNAVLSAAVCLRDIVPKAGEYDGFVVAYFSKYPLFDASREEVETPVIGIMDPGLWEIRVVGMGERSKIMHEKAVRAYGLDGYSVGRELEDLVVIDLEREDMDFV
ncbi:MAG: hypothetical protein MMC33_008373 [Icmadophila ericetorum]|nr:hypothetical protein [Icmadophila ericetorum]